MIIIRFVFLIINSQNVSAYALNLWLISSFILCENLLLLTNVTRLKLSSTYPKSHLPLPQSHLPIRLYGILTPNTQPHPRSCIPYPRSYITYPRSNIPHPKSHLPISLNRTPTPGYTYPIQGYTSFTCLTNYCRLHV